LGPAHGGAAQAKHARRFAKRRPISSARRRTAHEGTILDGTKTDHGEHDAGRSGPTPATLAWMIEAQIQLNSEDSELLFTTPTGSMWRERNFYRDRWKPAQQASGLDIRPTSAATPTSPIFAPPASTTST